MSKAITDVIDRRLQAIAEGLATQRTAFDAQMAAWKAERDRLQAARKILADPTTDAVVTALAAAGIEVKLT